MAAPPRRRFKIEPFKHKMEVDKGYADQTWSKLESAIKEINNHKTSGLSFEEVRAAPAARALARSGDQCRPGARPPKAAPRGGAGVRSPPASSLRFTGRTGGGSP